MEASTFARRIVARISIHSDLGKNDNILDETNTHPS